MLCTPYPTQGGPANPEKQGYLQTYWNKNDDSELFMIQSHKLGVLGSLGRLMKGQDADTVALYRVVVRVAQPWPEVARSDNWDEIVQDFKRLTELEKEILAALRRANRSFTEQERMLAACSKVAEVILSEKAADLTRDELATVAENILEGLSEGNIAEMRKFIIALEKQTERSAIDELVLSTLMSMYPKYATHQILFPKSKDALESLQSDLEASDLNYDKEFLVPMIKNQMIVMQGLRAIPGGMRVHNDSDEGDSDAKVDSRATAGGSSSTSGDGTVSPSATAPVPAPPTVVAPPPPPLPPPVTPYKPIVTHHKDPKPASDIPKPAGTKDINADALQEAISNLNPTDTTPKSEEPAKDRLQEELVDTLAKFIGKMQKYDVENDEVSETRVESSNILVFSDILAEKFRQAHADDKKDDRE